MRRSLLLLPLASAAVADVSAASANFAWERAQLGANETAGYPDIAFGDATGSNASYAGPKCRVGPGDAAWPAAAEWRRFNSTLGGALLKPLPPGAACYPGSPSYSAAQCQFLLTTAPLTRFYPNDPLTVLTAWAEGNTCQATWFPTGNCTQGGYPVYVVNVSTVRHIQLAVNFARNRNLRLVIKNSGHDFGGRSTGAGALSIWTHFLKDFEFLPHHTIDGYVGRAARVSAGIEAWELWNYMDEYNMTMVVPGGDTVGAFGGWTAGGGHNSLSSSYGLGSDQVLAFQVVTADGRYRTVTPHQNADLFFAMLGGGGSTYGVFTSAIVKAYPPTPVTNLPLSFQVGAGMSFGFGNFSFPPGNFSGPGNFSFPPFPPFPGANGTFPPLGNGSFPGFPFPALNGTLPGNFSFPFPGGGNGSFPGFEPPVVVNSTDIFWEGFWLYQKFAPVVCDAGGTLYSYLTKVSNTSYTFSTTFEMPNMTPREVQDLVDPLFKGLNRLGIPVANKVPETTAAFAPAARTGAGSSPGNIYFGSRLFPRANWDNDTIYNTTVAAIRTVVEAGYTFHGINHQPAYKIAGFPGNTTAISPNWRAAIMHADIFDYSLFGGGGGGGGFGGASSAPASPEAVKASHAKFNSYMDVIRAATPAGGSYFNEADVQEPNWQRSFFGANYARLARVKRARDPWGLFWAPTMPGSEAWAVGTADGLPTQNGPLCQTGFVEGDGEGLGGGEGQPERNVRAVRRRD
ncbi:hypothetical protein B0T26DRAFT_676704 [Lasiosphaeria miniovina]|uniref:FAD-binding PCMH-type domain-containing protein n=1 Tax=Lasiosphaeria miniovina TaxID=1954250 RepID=A0AA40DYP3_9PEZI|nr:uncharacterized protein B0T26DRAFT_676704 [Lasiosphaeria miniovina]KAK0718552.1 hypothetical protein B0T26DRAFT_676704 [Lasiosphaeria miniovina]